MKTAAYGTALAIQRLQTGSYTNLTNLKDISGPDVNAEQIDVTTHDSADFFAEFVTGIADGGEVSFDVVFDPTSAAHELMYNDVAARQLHNFKLILPGGGASVGNIAFAGVFTKMSFGAPVKDGLMASVTIKVSGKPVYTKIS